MNKIQNLAAFTSGVLLLSAANTFADKDPIIIGGFKYNVVKTDFTVTGNTHRILLDVYGDTGQEIIFDIEASVGGRGSQEVTKIRTCSVPAGAPLNQCWLINTQELISPEFKFDIELKTFCSGMPIAMDRENENELSDTLIENTWRSVNLLADRTMSTGGNCEQLQVDITAQNALSIDNIDLDITISYAF